MKLPVLEIHHHHQMNINHLRLKARKMISGNAYQNMKGFQWRSKQFDENTVLAVNLKDFRNLI